MEGARWQHAQLRVLSEQAQAAGCAVGTASYASRSAAWARGRARVSIYNRCCFVLSVCVCARVCGCEWVCVCLRFVSFEIGGAALPRGRRCRGSHRRRPLRQAAGGGEVLTPLHHDARHLAQRLDELDHADQRRTRGVGAFHVELPLRGARFDLLRERRIRPRHLQFVKDVRGSESNCEQDSRKM